MKNNVHEGAIMQLYVSHDARKERRYLGSDVIFDVHGYKNARNH